MPIQPAPPRPTEDETCPCRDGMFATRGADRRRFLFAAGSGVAALSEGRALADDGAPAGARQFDVPEDPTKEQGRAVGADGGYGSRSQFETVKRVRYPTPNENTSCSLTPLAGLVGNLTPSGLHFERHHGGIPTIDPGRHSLVVHGLVGTPKRFSMDDLRRLPSVTRKHFIECSGNGLTEWKKPTLKTVQGTHGLLSTSKSLFEVLRRPSPSVSCANTTSAWRGGVESRCGRTDIGRVMRRA